MIKIRNVYLLSLIVIGLIACTDKPSKNKKNDIKSSEEEVLKSDKAIPFEGIWTRKFSMGEGKKQQVFYTVKSEGIEYRMEGAVPMGYTIEMDTFIAKDNRWIGRKGEISYVIFAKNITNNSIALYKQKVESFEEALTIPFPSDSTRSQFTSWNVYQKNIE